MKKREVVLPRVDDNEIPRNGPNGDEIAVRAYEIFIARGGTHGNDVDDWLQAERELMEKNGHSPRLRSAAAQ